MKEKVEAIIDLIEDNLHQDLSLDELARCVNLTPSHLCYLFKTHKEISPMQFLKICRLEKACDLLETTILSIKEITAQVGIKDESHFMRDFKKFYGLTPSQYRAQNFNLKQAEHYINKQNRNNG